jgi:hypothetical protein
MTALSLTERAERALLGAVLADAQLGHLVCDLKPQDFATWQHAKIFAAVVGLEQRERGDNSGRVFKAVADGDYMARLTGGCQFPEHATAYARMVMEAAAQRGCISLSARPVGEPGARLCEFRRVGLDGQHMAGGIDLSADACAHVAASGVPAQWIPRRSNGSETLADNECPQAAFDPGRSSQRSGPFVIDGKTRSEEHVLAAIVQRHEDARTIPRWLPSSAFTAGRRRDLYAAILRLDELGNPVDALTVDWEHARYQAWQQHIGDDTSYASRLARLEVDGPGAVCEAMLMAHRMKGRCRQPDHPEVSDDSLS